MAKQSDQDLADKALAEEFGAYITAVATKIVEPIRASAQDAKFSIANSAQAAQSSINASLKKSEESFHLLIDTLGSLGIDLKSTVASVYDGHETTRKHLIDLLQRHKELAKLEAAEQVQQLGEAIHADLEPRLEALVKPVADVAAKSSLRQMEFAKQIGDRLLKEVRDSFAESARKSDTLTEMTTQLMQSIASVGAEAERRHRQLILVTGLGVVVQVSLLLLLALKIWL